MSDAVAAKQMTLTRGRPVLGLINILHITSTTYDERVSQWTYIHLGLMKNVDFLRKQYYKNEKHN